MATKVRSDEAEWLRISNQWNSTETTTMVDYFKIGLPSANRVIAAANTIGMPLSIDVTEHDISELERRRQLMAETTGNAFKEINEILDDKFVLGLKAVLDKVYALNPCDFTMDKTDPTGRVTSFGLDMLISSMLSKVNPKLQEDFQKKAEALNEDKVPKSLGEIIAAAIAEALKRLKDGKLVENEKTSVEISAELHEKVVNLAEQEYEKWKSGEHNSKKYYLYDQNPGTVTDTPWCAYFVSWILDQAGHPVGDKPLSAAPQFQDLKNGFTYHPIGDGYVPKVGDIVVHSGHVNIIVDIDKNGVQTTIGGNEGSDRLPPSQHDIKEQHYGGNYGDAVGYVTY